ncbi:hypothetical protein [Streptomyces sp. V3I7]|uniref:hypothetical protein n=1 Tax=Streptomyces sp. V3I7 TaxID=3042278 RepID=UPI002784AF5E|nr:hypothetical protein [Streptomyces sp. V3I7]MDQ0989268.1 hypothetical protein [Streptomyces sp. V3I7]
MRGILVSLVAAGAVLSSAGAAPAAERAADGDVVIFSTEVQPLDVIHDPAGCKTLPLAAHVLANRTDGPVKVYGNPFCVGPALTVQPGYGTHVPGGAGSFSS